MTCRAPPWSCKGFMMSSIQFHATWSNFHRWSGRVPCPGAWERIEHVSNAAAKAAPSGTGSHTEGKRCLSRINRVAKNSVHETIAARNLFDFLDCTVEKDGRQGEELKNSWQAAGPSTEWHLSSTFLRSKMPLSMSTGFLVLEVRGRIPFVPCSMLNMCPFLFPSYLRKQHFCNCFWYS